MRIFENNLLVTSPNNHCESVHCPYDNLFLPHMIIPFAPENMAIGGNFISNPKFPGNSKTKILLERQVSIV